MRKSFIITSAAVLAIASACSKIEVTTSPVMDEVVPVASQTISIPVAMEVNEDTKSYYLEAGSTWSFVPETYDQYHYFQMMWGACQEDGYAVVTKTESMTYISYPSEELRTGNVLYSYLVQPVFENELYDEAEELDDSNINSDPHAVLMNIPAVQTIDCEAEDVYTIIDHHFSILGPRMAQKTIDGATLQLVTVPENVLSFKIDGYDPDLTYVCSSDPSEKVSDFTVDEDGIASVTVNFSNYDISLNKSQTRTTTVTVAVSGYEDNFYASVVVTATRGRASTRSTYSAKLGAVHNEVISESEEGEVHYLPLRDAMPCVTKGLNITSSLLRYPEDIANCMVIYMLGSAAEFNIYSLESNIAGQTIKKVELSTPNEFCCGRYSYDLTSNSLHMTPVEGYQENKITADLEDSGYTVSTAKENAMSVHMVVGVGTYTTCQFDVYTVDAAGVEWCYTYQVSDKEFARSSMKVFNIKLTSAKAVRVDGNGGTDEDEDLA